MWGGPSTKATATLGSSWLICNGQAVSKTTYASLYEVLGDLYGSTSTTFLLPDFRSTFPIGATDTTNIKISYKGVNLNYGGDITIATAQLPAHNHSTPSSRITSVNGVSSTFGPNSAVGQVNYESDKATNNTGSGQDFLPPFQCINFYIKAI
jgi:microcystin-dependent protein